MFIACAEHTLGLQRVTEPIVNNLWITFQDHVRGLDSHCPTLCAILVFMKITRIKFKRFNKPHVLKKIGRDLLTQFFDRFKTELEGNGLALPPPEIPDDEYFDALSRLLFAPESLPDLLNEALFAIDEMATARGQQALEIAARSAERPLNFQPGSSREDIALQVWLTAPELLASAHNAQRLRRLTAFQYAGARIPLAQPAAFKPPGPGVLKALSRGLDSWFGNNQRGEQTARVEPHFMDGEYWFLVRHGDTFTRAPKVDRQRTEVLHFRPERDDVIVYNPEHDEIRINARTKGERDLYIEQFGLHLRGSADYFSARDTYTLEPLRSEGLESLDARDIDGISKIVLCELEVALDDANHEVITRAALDLFQIEGAPAHSSLTVPATGTLARAVFEFQFPGSPKPRPVEVRPPNILKFGRRCDARLVQSWLSRRGFRR